ncbi:MAG: hypothetical protein M3384_14880 [Acidobacteriota bacterium]|nr:hypothetical protein [Acidobacteriota bacterium]
MSKLCLITALIVSGLSAAAAGFSAQGSGSYQAGAENLGLPMPTPARAARAGAAKRADASKYEVPGGEEMLEMTRTVLLDFNDAVQTGDFADFRSKTAAAWQKQTTTELFNQVFGEFISKKVDISEIDSSKPVYQSKPSVETEGGMKKLIARGCYDVSPRPVKFILKWIPQGKEWKLFGIEVDTTVSSC